MIKTKEMIVNYRKWRAEHTSILIDGAAVDQVVNFKFLGVHLPLTPPGIEVQDDRKLGPSDVLGRMHYPLYLAVGCQAVAIPGGDTASQDALNNAL